MSADASDDDVATDSGQTSWRQWYHIPALALTVLFMLWVRVQPFDNFVSSDRVHFRGNDAYYHFRTTMYSVENWPRTSYMDPWTEFPTGTTVGQFGTLFDLAVATVAMIVGLGSPSEHQVAVIAVLTPAVIGSLCVIPVFYIVRRLTDGNTIAGLFGGFVFAILPTSIWLNRSTVGFYSHHIAENLLMATTILALLVAVSVAQRERPVYEQVLDQDWVGLQPTIKWSVVVGVAYALYIWTWPPGVIIIGVIGTYFLLAMVAEVLRDNTPEHLAFVAAISMGVGAFLSLFLIPIGGAFEFGTTDASLTQVFAPLVVGIGSVFMAWLARVWDQQNLELWKYPVTVGATGLAGLVFVIFALPDAWNTIWSNIERTLLLGQGTGTLTISEAQPMDTSNLGDEFFNDMGYGFTFLVALIGALWLAVQSYLRSERWEQYLVVVVWTVFLTLMAITQIRFHYYLVSVVAILNAYVFWLIYEATDFSKLTSPRDIGFVAATAGLAFGLPIVWDIFDISRDMMLLLSGVLLLLAAILIVIDYFNYAEDADLEFDAVESYHLMVILLIAIVIVIPVASPVAAYTAPDIAEQQTPGEVEVWEEGNDWIAEHTPQPGNYGEDTNNAGELPYYGTFSPTDDYDYPEGAYGVMSWWDYGHWITVEGERIPIANPFQANAHVASEYLLTDDEERAELILEALPAEENPYEYTNEELREIVENREPQEEQEETRYVMIDHEMAGGKFPAITQWQGPDILEFQDQRQYQTGPAAEGEDPETTSLPVTTERYDDTMLASMYLNDADGLQHYRLVHEVDDYAHVGGNTFGGAGGFDSIRIETLAEAIADAGADEEDPLFGEDGTWSEELAEFNQQLQFADLQGQLGPYQLWDGQITSTVKTFERVEGATITGSAEPETQVSVNLPLETNNERETFYQQTVEADEDGSFEITVPYPTTEELTTDDGFTESGVEATDEYDIEVLDEENQPVLEGSTAVPETAVVNGETIEIELTEFEPPEDDETGEGGDETDGDDEADGGDETDGDGN